MTGMYRKWPQGIGIVLLLGASVISSEWVRSYSAEDAVRFTCHGRRHLILSARGYITWWAWNESSGDARLPIWMSRPLQSRSAWTRQKPEFSFLKTYPHTDVLELIFEDNEKRRFGESESSYAVVTWPLMVCAAGLLLGTRLKNRKRG